MLQCLIGWLYHVVVCQFDAVTCDYQAVDKGLLQTEILKEAAQEINLFPTDYAKDKYGAHQHYCGWLHLTALQLPTIALRSVALQ